MKFDGVRFSPERGSAGRRRGWSLLEQMIAITLGSIVMGILFFSMLGVLRLHQGVRDRGDAHRDLARLATQFRADARRSDSSDTQEMPGQGEAIQARFSLAGKNSPRIEYSASPAGRVIRVVQMPDNSTSREEYSLPEGSRFGLEKVEGQELVLRLEVPVSIAGSQDKGLRVWRIVAALGATKRLLEQQGLRMP